MQGVDSSDINKRCFFQERHGKPLGTKKKHYKERRKKKLIMCQGIAGGIIDNHYRFVSVYLIWVCSVPEHFFVPTIRVHAFLLFIVLTP